jgi:regulator of cell morphogenesis and NO signaling
MPARTSPPSREPTLAELATTRPGAALVFHRHGLDFCCHGQADLATSCRARGLDPAAIAAELGAAEREARGFERWDERPLPELIEHLLERYHRRHRADLPPLVAMARKVEEVHAAKASCPRGLAALLARVAEELEQHMQKEEQVLFPMLLAGRGRMAAMPIQVMEHEHVDHGRNLERLRAITNGYVPPSGACTTWRALYLGLRELDEQLMQHIHLENNVLFPRALRA